MTPPVARPRSRLLLLLAVVLLALLAAVAQWPPETPAPSTAPSIVVPAPPSGALPVPARRAPAMAPRAPLEVPEPAGASGALGAGDTGASDEGPGPYLELYEGRSGLLSRHTAPPGTLDSPRLADGSAQAPHLVVWAESVRVQSGEEAVIRATLSDARGQPLPNGELSLDIVHPERLATRLALSALPPGGEAHFERRVPVRTEAAGRDAAPAPPEQVVYRVTARGLHQGQPFERTVAHGFFVHTMPGRLRGEEARVRQEDGNLLLSVPLSAERAGTYWAYAELWGGDGAAAPIAFARQRLERLPAGESTVTLLFGGRILRDRGVDGPYVIRNVRLLQVDTLPPQEQAPLDRLPPTPAWKASDFR